MYGSGSKPSEDSFYKKFNRERERERDRGREYGENTESHGVIIYHKQGPPPIVSRTPDVRIAGRPVLGPPPHTSVHDSFIRHYSDRKDTSVFGIPHIGSNKNDVFLPPPSIFESEDELTLPHNGGGGDSNNEGDQTEVEVCTKKCDEESEYLCSKACLCINKIHYCDGKFC